MPQPLAHIIRHVNFEDLGSFAAPLEQAGYRIEMSDAATADLSAIDPLGPDLLVVLGGPVGVYEQEAYPFLAQELDLLRRRLAADRPTLGICLGAQLIAAALGASVYGGPGKEIGWSALTLTEAGRAGPLAALEDVSVLHWHGDTFDLPEGCTLLASTPLCRQQAFARGPHVLGLQFHPELLTAHFEHWLIGHACEIAQAGLDPRMLRADTQAYGARLEAAAVALLEGWLRGFDQA